MAVLAVATFGVNNFTRAQTITSVVWRRSGGFAGLVETLTIESDGSVSLTSNITGEKEHTLIQTNWTDLLSLIEDTGFTEFDALYEPRTGTADFFTYRLEVKKGSRAKQVEWVDDWASKIQLPDGLKDVEEYMLSIIAHACNECSRARESLTA